MDVFSKITAIIVLFTSTGLITLLLVFKKISPIIFFILLFVILLSEVAILVFSVSSKMSKLGRVNDKPIKNSFRYVFEKVNDELQNMPNPDALIWNKGKQVNTRTKEFNDANNKTQRFTAITALTKYSGREVVVYYNTTDDIFWDWVSDPSPYQLMNPFDNFDPYPRKSFGYEGFNNRYKPSRRGKKGINISMGDDGYESNKKVNDFADSLNINKPY